MGAKEGALILDLIARLKEEGRVSMIMVLHNYVHVLTACDRVNLIQDGVISLDKPTVGDLGRGADRDRRRRVPARAPSGPSRRGLSHGRVERTCVIGVDFGTLSGRAVVVRGQRRRGARLGGPRVRARRHRARAAGVRRAPAAAMGAAGPRGLHRRPARGGARGRRRGRHRARRRSSGSRPTSPPRRRCRCSPTARRCAGSTTCASARTPTPSSGSTTRRAARPIASTPWRASAASPGSRATAA